MYKMGETVEMSTFSTEQVHVSFPPLKNMFKVPRKQIYFLGKNIDMLIKERWKFSAMQIKIKKNLLLPIYKNQLDSTSCTCLVSFAANFATIVDSRQL